jgi:hypothetical protein
VSHQAKSPHVDSPQAKRKKIVNRRYTSEVASLESDEAIVPSGKAKVSFINCSQ